MKTIPSFFWISCVIALFSIISSTEKISAEEQPSEESEIDRILAEKFPLPQNVPLHELVDDYTQLPSRFIPKEIMVNIPLEYTPKDQAAPEKKQNLQANHLAKVVKISATEIIISPTAQSGLESRVAIKNTDFKTRIEKLYDLLMKDAHQQVYKKRQAMRPKIAAELRRKKPQVSEFNPKKYGKKFSGAYFPKLRNGLGQKVDHEVPLGPIAGKALALFHGKEATITELWPKGPGAKAGLKVGDRIIKVNGKSFSEYPPEKGDNLEGFPKDIGMAIIAAQATGAPLTLTIHREENEKEIPIPLSQLPAFSDTYPADCPRSSFIITTAAEWLIANQKDNGTWQNQDYTNAWAALSLLATGNKEYQSEIKKTARHFAEKYAMKSNPSNEELMKRFSGGLDNWRHCIVGIFLAEYYLATGDKKMLPAIEACSRRMEARLQPETGRLGHQDTELPYRGFGLVIINVQAHILWALHAQINHNEWNWEPWELSYRAVTAAMGKPGVIGYSKASRGPAQSGTRTGAMATALALVDKEKSTRRKMGDWLVEKHRRLLDTHSMTSLGLIFGLMGIKNTEPRKLPDCYQSFQWKYALVTPPHADHGLFYFGQKVNHNGDKYLNHQMVANWMTILTLSTQRSDTLWVFGNRKNEWYK